MTAPGLPTWMRADGPALVPRCRGFGAELLGLAPATVRHEAESLIRAVRQERDLLSADLALACADPTLLPEALGCGVREREGGGWEVGSPADAEPADWGMLEAGPLDELPAFAAAIEAAAALARQGPTAVLLCGPLTLAGHVAGGAVDTADLDGEALLDACALTVRDAADAILAIGAQVVLEECRAPDAGQLALYAPLLNVLRHRRAPCLAVVLEGGGGELSAVPDAVAAVAAGAAAPAWDDAGGSAAWTGGGAPVVAPEVPATASPERVQELVGELRAGQAVG